MKYSLGFIGCGNMGRAMLAGALNAGLTTPERISVHTHTDAHQQKIAADYGVQALASNRDVAAESEIIVLAVKPNIYKDVILDVRDVLTAGQIVCRHRASVQHSLHRCACGQRRRRDRARHAKYAGADRPGHGWGFASRKI